MSRSRALLALIGASAATLAIGQEVTLLPDAESVPGPDLIGGVTSVISEGGETLDSAWTTALSVDPGLEASRWQASAAQRGLFAARAERLPSVSASGGYNVFDNPLTLNAPVPAVPGILPGPVTASVTTTQDEFFLGNVRVVQPIYTFGRIRSTIDAAGAEVTAAVANEEVTELDVKLQVAAAFVRVLQAQRLLEVAQENVESLEKHRRDVANQIDEGVGIRANLLAVEVSLADARQLRLQTQNLLVVASAQYNRALQRPLETPVTVADLEQPTTRYDLDLAISEAMRERPEIGELSARARALRSLASAVRAGSKPQVFVEGGVNYIENEFLDNEVYNNVSVLAEWNFWDSGRKGNRATKLQQQAEALLRKRSEAESLIALEVKSAWHDLSTALAQVEVNRATLGSADENLRVTANRYREGEGTNTEVLDAQTLRTSAYSNFYTSLYSAVLAEMQLRRAVGIL